jgi:hypothetical protein
MNGPNLRYATLCLPSSIRTLVLGLERRLPVSVAPLLQNACEERGGHGNADECLHSTKGT